MKLRLDEDKGIKGSEGVTSRGEQRKEEGQREGQRNIVEEEKSHWLGRGGDLLLYILLTLHA